MSQPAVAWTAVLVGLVLATLAAPARATAVGAAAHAAVPAVPALPGITDEARARRALDGFHESLGRGQLHAGVLVTLGQLIAHDHPVIVDGLIELLAHGSPALLPTARRVLAAQRSPESLARLDRRGVEHRDARVREQVLLALADGRPQGLDWAALAGRALADPSPPVRAAAVRAVGLARDEQRLGDLVELSADPSPRVRQAVPRALVRLVGARALPVLDRLAEDDSWRVRGAVVEALAELKTRSAVERLVQQLGREQGRLREDVLTALQRLTGKAYGLSLPAWEAFLEQAPADFLSRADAVALERASSSSTVASYHGLWTLSTRFLFVTDVSTSMDHVDAGRYGTSERVSRLAYTKRELERLLEDLEQDVLVNLMTFSDGVRTWKRGLVAVDARSRRACLREVDDYRTLGGTNVFAALETILDDAEADLDGLHGGEDTPDTVFLLTDGEPSVGALQDGRLLLEYVAERNRVLGLRFQTVSLSRTGAGRDFLVRLARQTGGGFVSPLD